MEKIKLGILFGGPSREREISFAGGRTVYDNLDKSIFEPIPIFVDSNKQLILLDWEFIYKGSIRDFYPPINYIPDWGKEFQIYIESLEGLSREDQSNIASEVGIPLSYGDLNNNIDVAFLALHGAFGEDGQIQAILDSMEIPYTGSGILASSIGIDKSLQKKLMASAGFPTPASFSIKRADYIQSRAIADIKSKINTELGDKFVIRPSNQGSSIGVSILESPDDKSLRDALDNSFFVREIDKDEWLDLSIEEKVLFVAEISDIRSGVGMPVELEGETIYHPKVLMQALDSAFIDRNTILLQALDTDKEVLLESFIDGKEFSCIVLRKEDGQSLALPPTEIIKSTEVYDYRSKYLPGLSSKKTPIDLELNEIKRIQKDCEQLFEFFEFHTYARIDGFYQTDGTIYLNDPNTTSGMLPSSFFFHQAAELGINPSQLISYIIRQSVSERSLDSNKLGLHLDLLSRIDEMLLSTKSLTDHRAKVGVILGGYSSERHISVESGRNIYEKLASSGAYEAVPIFLKKTEEGYELYQLPINLLLKDNADDISYQIDNYVKHELIELLREEGDAIINKYSSATAVLDPAKIEKDDLRQIIDMAFIALHGRPGEDGELQKFLEQEGIPYNGSGPRSSSLTINKYKTLQLLKKEGFIVAEQLLVNKSDFYIDKAKSIHDIEHNFDYPLIAKPVDDGCSSAVMLIKSNEQLLAYLEGIFRSGELTNAQRESLGLKRNEEFPAKQEVLIEERIGSNGAVHFLEITGGLLTNIEDNKISFEIFEPSEALAGDEILSLEEKFLAGEGQNITPARFANTQEDYTRIASVVKKDFERAARILGVEGYARIDAFVRVFDDRVETIIIEVNSLPGMTPATCIFHQSALNGYKPFDFIQNILNFAIERQKQKAVM